MLTARRSYSCRILISFRRKLLLNSRLLTADDIHVTPAGRLNDHGSTGDNWRDNHITALLNQRLLLETSPAHHNARAFLSHSTTLPTYLQII